MDRQIEHAKQTAQAEECRCLLCEAAIEMADHEVYFVTGYCRFCQAALEEDED